MRWRDDKGDSERSDSQYRSAGSNWGSYHDLTFKKSITGEVPIT
jgi:hypothetical protein